MENPIGKRFSDAFSEWMLAKKLPKLPTQKQCVKYLQQFTKEHPEWLKEIFAEFGRLWKLKYAKKEGASDTDV